MKNLPAYEPPVDEQQLLLKWIRRARESQMSHYDMADLLSARDRQMGWLVTVLAAFVGTAVFASLNTSGVSFEIRLLVGLVSVVAAVSSALQTYLRYAERAEKHRAAGARYGAVRRRLEAVFAGDADALNGHYLSAIREELDRLAQDSPNVPPRNFYRTQRALSTDPRRSTDA
ncbi:SLATT domain-containing protein [bacterium M00.F.Ca.ET.228.01.1.1]|uniref:SMODS and SLOG-associating 2TM effector domain-containing protein n=1 Tax=Burkholderia sp. (strain CCGE1003) TaxID=640512 RepID=E1TIB2_BURSG|nr:SLATT domain-containing protein [Paraburkholderia phenoliruptrix]MBW9131262.1 SLATT domain-containing protein [Paraburkholderia ginsengiterrae]TGP46272.1 SLATT domain-containing protein [bacterium M00.F.Ca.ET.228.01.1.1]TGS03814.1 SLATT domain-containing protein [bacterium M00.F.Ca.ET.191.01.1.1]TGU07566.1 SLATT domain-containing protein [bacterium M00.F.Ca.ET.155.01.1.1]MBW0446315.1 SLATT domain-containing protein [Paraburkholderia phenoliruptrix]